MHSAASEALEILSQWNRCHGAFYQVRESDLRWNLERQALLRYRTASIYEIPVLYAVASEKGIAAGIPSMSLWISLWGEIPEGDESKFLDACLALLQNEGKYRLAFAGEEFHFLPGVPSDEESGSRLLSAARAAGFEQAEACDYSGRLNGDGVSAYIAEASQRAKSEGWTLESGRNSKELDELHAFLQKEFPGRWTREFEYWLNNPESQRASWMLFRDGEKHLSGFARMAVRGNLKPQSEGWNPGALRLPQYFGEPLDTDACLGPIGIAANERGRGAGRVLLGLTLQKIAENNALHVCIDWTNAHNYYKPLRFQVVRRFCSLWKKLQS